MSLLSIDFESCSAANLPKTGAYKYACDISTQVLCLGYVFDNEKVEYWTPAMGPLPQRIVDHVARCGRVRAWNAAFEYYVWNFVLRRLDMLSIPVLHWEQLDDTMAQAAYWGLPLSLDQAAEAMGLPGKDKDGHRLMMQMCKPRADGTFWHETHPDKLDRLAAYCVRDVQIERALGNRLPPLPDEEREIWLADKITNSRGVYVDLAFADKLEKITEQAKAKLTAQLKVVSGGQLTSLTKPGEMLKAVQALGSPLTDLKRDTVQNRLRELSKPSGPAEAREKAILEIRLDSARASTAKLKAMRAAEQGGRLVGMLQHYGATRTGRWAGRLVQVQNLPRPTIKNIEDAELLVESGATADDLEPFFTDSPMGVVASSLRGCLAAPPGWELISADLAQIEARVVAWLAGQDDILEVFARREDVYTYTANKLGSTDRQLGKTCVAENTPVLTSNGWKRIQDVLLSDLVWDGIAWVSHKGLIEKGHKETLQEYGLPLTPDHRVLCGNTWLPALSLAQDGKNLSQALVTGSENLLSRDTLPALAAASAPLCVSAGAKALNILSSWTVYAVARHCAAMSAQRNSPGPHANCTGGTRAYCQTTNTGNGCSIASRPVSGAAKTPEANITPTTEGEASGYTPRGSKTGRPFSRILSRLTAGTGRSLSWIGRTLTVGMSRGTSGSSQKPKTPETAERCKHSKNVSQSSKPSLPVYDLADCGPRHRFLILTEHGPMIVHNCVLGLGFGMGADRFQSTAKLNRVILSAPQAAGYVADWRAANPKIVQFWWDLDRAAKRIASGASGPYRVGAQNVLLERRGRSMIVTLPSGRQLTYRDFRLEIDPDTGNDNLTYSGVHQITKRWTDIRTYGGKLCENIVQAVARDIAAASLLTLHKAKRRLVFTAHDELVAEAPKADAPDVLAHMLAVLRNPPHWAVGLPVWAEGWHGPRYKKG
jgi:DNA polymerase bacteriophage-type